MVRFALSKRIATEEASRRTTEAPRALSTAELDAVAGGKMKRLLRNRRQERQGQDNGGWTGTGAGGSW